jgi:uncharacterized protein YqfB (UPF0267 family)
MDDYLVRNVTYDALESFFERGSTIKITTQKGDYFVGKINQLSTEKLRIEDRGETFAIIDLRDIMTILEIFRRKNE